VEVVVDWPHRYLAAEAAAGRLDRRTAVCVLTHDPKFDAPALETALGLDLAYVGAMGSRRAHDERSSRLLDAGVSPSSLARLHTPIGLDLGAATPEETAVAILGEILLTRSHTSGKPLSQTSGHIHPSPVPDSQPEHAG
jgi:xanthine dehydrogenase accessory factor